MSIAQITTPRTHRPSPSSSRSFGLDVMRALASLAVMGSHYGAIGVAHTGMPGADLIFIFGNPALESFFILSGFLIGNILYGIIDSDTPGYKAWWRFEVRRFLRIAPPYYLWLLIMWVFFPPTAATAERLYQYLTYTQNLAWPMPADNWFGVSWSLTVEEWFYLLFSIFAIAGSRLWGRRGLALIIIAFLVLPLLARAMAPVDLPWDASVRKIALYRLDAIAYGAALAAVMQRTRWIDQYRVWLGVLGLSMLACMAIWWLFAVGHFELRGWWPRTFMLNALAISIILMLPAMYRLKPWGRVATVGVTWLSDVSYTTYLAHLPMLALFMHLADQHGWPLWSAVVLAITATYAVATISLYFLERPILRRRPRQTIANPKKVPESILETNR